MEPFTVIGLTTIIGRLLPEPHAGLLAGILFGTKATLAADLKTALITSGTIHMIALSGQNISILVTVMTSFLVILFSRRTASLLIMGMLVGYVAFVGVSPSVVRAAVMGSISLFAVIIGRASWSILTWILAVSSMILLHPLWIADVGFQLSAFASLGIILFGKARYRYESKPNWHTLLLRAIDSDLRITLAAQSLTIPLILLYFHRVSLVAPLSNLAIGWTMPLLMIAGWLAAIMGWIFLPLGQVFAWVCWMMLEWIVRVVLFVDTIPFASIGW
jgi:competence protein ComEC